MMMTIPIETLKSNLSHIKKRIKAACDRSGRGYEEVRIMAVTKSFPQSYIFLAREAGISLFGENRVQEAYEKFQNIKEDSELHLIGHLQRNKAKRAAQLFSWVQSIDKYETAAALERHTAHLDKKMNILIEVNTSSEDSKFGLKDKEDYWRFLEQLSGLPHLIPRGLMTVGPFTTDKDRIRESFSRLRELFIMTKTRYPDLPFDTLSMGMSSDYEIAVEQGSTLVRIGTALFGKREYTNTP
jgi:pyridoxal phosphate enzyme (YggS family)